jgi:hypothetical protein
LGGSVSVGSDRLSASGTTPRRAAQLAAGLSNREIAQHLFITTRTVEGHRTHAYQKLAITSRDQLPAARAPDGGPTAQLRHRPERLEHQRVPSALVIGDPARPPHRETGGLRPT